MAAAKKTAAKKTAAKKTAAKKTSAAAVTADALLAKLPEPRRSEMNRVHAFITKALPKLEVGVTGSMIGYGPFRYRYESGREGDGFRISLASRAGYIALYALGADDKGYVAERYAAKLPNASIGKSCVRFAKLDELDARVLEALLLDTVKTKYLGS